MNQTDFRFDSQIRKILRHGCIKKEKYRSRKLCFFFIAVNELSDYRKYYDCH